MRQSSNFSTRLIQWQQQYGRHRLPWQVKNPYAVWLSEIMLQQTQVATVLDYYPRFLNRFPDVESLANAAEDDILSLWAGLGYYSRARNLHKASKQIIEQFSGEFPQTRIELETLCGVGRSTAAAISAFAFNQRETILDGNVKRVLCRVYGLDGNPQDKKFENQLWQLAESLLPSENSDMPAYTQGLMDLGATVCKRTKPLCHECPMSNICEAKKQNRIAELPRKKTAVEVQTLPLYWLIVRNRDNRILLRKRPAKGIWGGLYCVPCFENLVDLYQYTQTLNLDSDGLNEQAAFTHRLTHRLLMITPFTTDDKPSENISDGLWIAQENLADYGLPKPLLNYLNQAQKNLF
ncbi:A/G-specific adenine glycosylase [Neisseria iguanae]|uniref:Adenine DNA glycosylase n=1 Tax=Neisseria iguanae TaxID=90242 RepID=A0A2P7TX06_9NEIS|nr:A/G-specific adenine glycosylase [Neisseria iguanae]PSJ79272.1 A/G-specific adenine glycosylase [Neisseria iguanae]